MLKHLSNRTGIAWILMVSTNKLVKRFFFALHFQYKDMIEISNNWSYVYWFICDRYKTYTYIWNHKFEDSDKKLWLWRLVTQFFFAHLSNYNSNTGRLSFCFVWITLQEVYFGDRCCDNESQYKASGSGISATLSWHIVFPKKT